VFAPGARVCQRRPGAKRGTPASDQQNGAAVPAEQASRRGAPERYHRRESEDLPFRSASWLNVDLEWY
jgi:hypothetical protein